MSAQIWNCDGIPGMTKYLDPESIDLCVTSIPFGALFMYSGKPEDVGNNQDGTDMKAGGFGLHMRFFVHQLYRVMKSGCNVCIHIQQLLRYQNQHGYMGRRDFRGAVIDLCCAGGFEYRGEFVIPKNPQIIAKRLSLHSLQFMTGHSRNARDLSPAVNDYVLQFQKPGESAPVLCLKHSTKNPHGWVTQEEWIRDAHGVWTDIRETDVLDGWKSARETDEEKHVCPLQLEVIRRCIKLWTNPGELVLDPYMGIGSTAYVAIEQGREAIGFELKESYCDQAWRNAKKADRLVIDKEKAPPLLELMQTASALAPLETLQNIEPKD
jgi:DNA modification methylase